MQIQMLSELEVYEAGELTVIGFGGHAVLDRISLGQCREDLMNLIQEHGCETLAIDLTKIRLIPSGMLGLLNLQVGDRRSSLQPLAGYSRSVGNQRAGWHVRIARDRSLTDA